MPLAILLALREPGAESAGTLTRVPQSRPRQLGKHQATLRVPSLSAMTERMPPIVAADAHLGPSTWPGDAHCL
ncbi:hypothetical protein VTO73DRAFT_15060 [Trametes versicolor]